MHKEITKTITSSQLRSDHTIVPKADEFHKYKECNYVWTLSTHNTQAVS